MKSATAFKSREFPQAERWEFPQSNAEQRYATHGFFRYYGKLPPVVTKRILEESKSFLSNRPGVDVACGSGTTLVEAALLGIQFEGLDINPMSTLVSRVKTTPIKLAALDREWARFSEQINDTTPLFNGHAHTLHIPDFQGRDRWFTPSIQQELAILIQATQAIADEQIRDFLTLALAGTIRKVSNASERAGRIFKQTDKVPPRPWIAMQKRVHKMREGLSALNQQLISQPSVRLGDAKATNLKDSTYGLVFFHPPYFALYKYSSDVLRFELNWLGFDRKQIVQGEIRDGFKTTRTEDVEPYLDDLQAVLREARRIVHPKGAVVVVSNNSTLKKEELPIISGIKDKARAENLELIRDCTRTVRFAQTSYHRSADQDIKTDRDHIMFFKPV